MSSLLKIPVSLLLIFSSLSASGGVPHRPSAGAPEAGTGYACTMKNSLWSTFHNQAMLPRYNSLSFGFNYENRFALKELGTSSAAIIVPAGKASIGAIYSHFGYSEFKREMAGLACGLVLSENISAGVQVDWFSERTAGEYSNNDAITCEAGVIISPSENVRVGIHIFNPIPGSLRKSYMPTALRAGAGIDLSSQLFAAVETEMSTGKSIIIRTGLEYEVVKQFRLRGGFSTENSSFSFGLGYMIKGAQLDIGFMTHESLGVTSSASLIFKIH